VQKKNNGSAALFDKSQIEKPESEQSQIFIDSEAIFIELTDRIKGQDDAMRALAEITQIHLAQVEPKMPATIFMAGPTGTGKTESAIVLLDAINHISKKKYQMLRINCNQYKEGHRVAQLLGSPNGYVGYGDPPVIVPLAKNARTIVLWDEIEKAHSDIFDVIMGGMDTGKIQIPTLINGSNEIDCRRAIFIFTSNLPVFQAENRKLGFAGNEQTAQFQCTEEMFKNELVSKGIKPEIAGRILSFILFKPLDSSVLADIIAIAIVDCAKSFSMAVKHIDVAIIQELLDANSSSFGARTYKQEIQKKLGRAFAAASKSFLGKDIFVLGTLGSPIISIGE